MAEVKGRVVAGLLPRRMAETAKNTFSRVDFPLVIPHKGDIVAAPLPTVRGGMADAKSSSILCWRGCCSGNVSLFNQRETVAWPIPTWLAMAVYEKPSLRKVTTCWYPARRSSRFAWLSAVAFGLADRAAVWVAQFPVMWLLTPPTGCATR